MEKPQNWLTCLVCHEKTRFYHANAQICRPCATFHRRVLAEGIKYECKFGGNCEISASRTCCRSCRFNRCLKAGAHLNVPKPTATTSEVSSLKGKSSQILTQLIDGFDQFLYVQRSIHLSLTPEIGLDDKNVIMAQKRLIILVERQSTVVLVKMFDDCFGPFKKLTTKQKLNVISEVLPEFRGILRAYLTNYYFPDVDDNRIMFTNGYYMSADNSLIQWFLEGYIEKEKIDNYLTVVEPLIHKYLKCFSNFKRIGIRKEDTVAMTLLALWKRIELANLLDEEMVQYKDKMMEEWIADLRKTYGSKQSIIQLGKILEFYSQCDDISNELQNVVTYLNVTELEIDKDQLCEVTEYIKNLDIGNDVEETLI